MYQDVSTGQLAAEINTKTGPCDCMRANPWNGVMGLGHGNGVVSFWSPALSSPLVKILAHRGKVNCLGFHRDGQ